MSLKDKFAQTVAMAKYVYATRITAVPPPKVRTILESQGWKFESPEHDNNPTHGAAAMGMAFAHHARHVILSPFGGKNIYTSGTGPMRYYKQALASAARQAYGLN